MFSKLPNANHHLVFYNKILDTSKFKAFVDADYKINVPEMIVSVFDGEENSVGKGETADNQHFLLSPHFLVNQRQVNF